MSNLQGNTRNGSISASPEKKSEKAFVVELKNGKVIFKQKPTSFEKNSETLQEIVTFRGILEERISKQETPLTIFPEAFKPLIAKLAHESDKTLPALVKHIHHELLPTVDDDDEQSSVVAIAALPVMVVEDVIKAVLTRNNYGLDAPLGVKLPAAVCVWRWEVRPEYIGWLPKNSREKAEIRQTERVQARHELKKTFDALSQDERNALIDPKKTHKLPNKEMNRPETTPNPEMKVDEKPASESAKKQGKKKEESENDQTDIPKGAARPKKAQDPEKTVKDKDRQEKKAARMEKEQKEKDAKNKSQNIMAKFFNKPKAAAPTVRIQQPMAVAGPSKVQSDFERTFKPFVLGKDKVLAPQNWFKAERKRRRRIAAQGTSKTIIVVDSEDEHDVEMIDTYPSHEELSSMTPQERLRLSLVDLPPPLTPTLRLRNPPGFKIYHPESVRDIFTQLSEAEVSGNAELVRDIQDKLTKRDNIPAKAFCFHTDTRPGYFGTWTRNSKIIGPRRPLVKDTLVFDYAYDSGEEWEVEAAGDVDDAADDQDDEPEADSDRDSDLDSWLVDDDESPVDLAELTRRGSPPPLIDLTTSPSNSKRKAEEAEKKSKKKRKVDPLVPVARGPIYETTIGDISHELFHPFEPYGIQRFNDTPVSIDPFTFVSEFNGPPTSQDRKIPATDGVYVLPALPLRLAPALSSAPTLSTTAPKKPPTAPKTPFPEAHLSVLINKITQLQTSSINALVEAIYHDLREHKVKKNAVEAKVREVAEKCRDKKVWIVKPDLMQTSVAS
ncbi:hypothetical protein CPB83DRAFT_880065 [Crepidotus variabilis]|uniref:Chromatin assembly factor 1 subunit A dimerization domain-containing protein n=1 Tax=Crepidotus variabilis TaxID=179855 RepID=A0A9P6JVJ3_9AGAR|nr:hypothetical protein CPB83DRAFT_880065 [Crepidotus variabilis]